jgi:hypothetical protein
VPARLSAGLRRDRDHGRLALQRLRQGPPQELWQDVLGPAARAAGPVTVATADHHGMFDGLDGDIVRTLRPRVWVVQSWHIAHPDMLQLERMFSERHYPGPRDVFATSVMRENLLANGRLTRRLRSHDGHVVVRVEPRGGHRQCRRGRHHETGDRAHGTLNAAPCHMGDTPRR